MRKKIGIVLVLFAASMVINAQNYCPAPGQSHSDWLMEFLNGSALSLREQARRGIVPNGCGSAQAVIDLIPDGIVFFYDWEWACNQHDMDYSNLNMTRAKADRRLKANMIAAGAPSWIANLFYKKVREHGAKAWKIAQDRASGIENQTYFDESLF